MKLRNWHSPGSAGEANAKEFDITRAPLSLRRVVSTNGPAAIDVCIYVYREDGKRQTLTLTPQELGVWVSQFNLQAGRINR